MGEFAEHSLTNLNWQVFFGKRKFTLIKTPTSKQNALRVCEEDNWAKIMSQLKKSGYLLQT